MLFKLKDYDDKSLGIVQVENTPTTRDIDFEWELRDLAKSIYDTCNELGGDTDWFWENLPSAVEEQFGCKCERVFLNVIQF